MKLSVSSHFTDTRNIRGFQKFGSMLLEELSSNFGVQIVKEKSKSHVHLTVISGRAKPGCKNVVRLDGVYYDVERMSMNSSIRSTIRKSDGVIFQSQWCEIFVTRMLKTIPRNSIVAYNGCQQSKLQNIVPYSHSYDKAFVCCANWRINKRLKSIVRAFSKARKGKNIGLFVLGSPDYDKSYDGVHYFGNVKGDKLWSIYKSSNYMCHICHIDACPNSVVEALSVGLPVLCNNIGGTPELVKNDGIILPLDKPFNFMPIKDMEVVGPGSIDKKILIDGMLRMLEKQWSVSRPDLDISVSAKQYYNFFEKLLK